MRIVVLEGSPNKKGSSNLLADEFIRGAKEAGHTMEVIDAAHICKSCSRFSAVEKAEMQTINRLMELPLRHLGQSEKKWLENRIHDSRPEVAGLAKEVYREYFPYAERNAMNKQLVISELDLKYISKSIRKR